MKSTDSKIGKALITEINKTTDTIDFAIYGLRHQDEVIKALKAAQDRGVRVRGVVDMNVDNENCYIHTSNLINKIKAINSDYKADLRKQNEGRKISKTKLEE